MATPLLHRLFGPLISRYAAATERLGNAQALAVRSSDALSWVAYATQEILAVLVLAGSAAVGAGAGCDPLRRFDRRLGPLGGG